MFFNRLKIFLALLVILFLGILFWQNQELLALKLLCPDINQSCLYQTPQLPLALWMFFFLLAGVVTSLIWQLLNYLSAKSLKKNKSSASTSYFSESENTQFKSQTNTKSTNTQFDKRASVKTNPNIRATSATNSPPESDWEDTNRNDDWNTEESSSTKVYKPNNSINIDKNPSDRARQDSSPPTDYSKSRSPNQNKENRVDRVYDANYRVINPFLNKRNSDSVENKQDDTDEEWI